MGLLHIYCGSGKGKTTAAVGLAVRAAGAGLRVHIVQLMKGGETSELSSLKLIPEISVSRLSREYGFTFNMTDEERSAITAEHNSLLSSAAELMNGGAVDMLIIDEFFSAYNSGLLHRELAESTVLTDRTCELVLTGRDPSEKFIAAADYVSEIHEIKHPYTRGIEARKGIEY